MRTISLYIFWTCVFTSMVLSGGSPSQDTWLGCTGTCADGTAVSEWIQRGCYSGHFFTSDVQFDLQGAKRCVGNCRLCNNNTYMDREISDSVLHCYQACKTCLPGTYSTYERTQLNRCDPCGIGLYRGATDASCVACPVGQITPTSTSSDVSQCSCPEGLITQTPTSPNMSPCACPSGLTLISGSCVPCLADKYSVYQNKTIVPCTPCGIGRYQGLHDESC